MCKVIADSISSEGIRLTTLQLHYWRPIHSELMTHRVFSRNARSSRAVPVTTLLKEEAYTPHFMQNRPGMQALAEMDREKFEAAQEEWSNLIGLTRKSVEYLHELGVHKQWANRPLEWFGWIDVLVTSTDWANWFALRDHPDAMPEIQELAKSMWATMQDSTPELLGYSDWHLPYVTNKERDEWKIEQLKVMSAARCARLSYKPFDGEADYAREQERYDRLVVSTPVHASPTEHIATPDFIVTQDLGKGQSIRTWQQPEKHGNFVGWVQHRKEIPNEAVFDDHYRSL